MTYILFIWTIVGGSTNFHGADRDWRYSGDFQSNNACHAAARELNVKIYRCVSNKG